MRTIGFRSNILFAIAAACGVIAALGRPWYGPSKPGTDAEMEDLFSGIARAFSEPGGTTGWEALGSLDTALTGLAVLTVALLLLTLVPALQQAAQTMARWSALATVAVAGYALVGGPGGSATEEPRQGLFLAIAAALVLLTSTMVVASAPSRRRTPPRTYTPPPAPAPVALSDDERWGPPQF